jgi:AcrR family transcriptional regulator
VTDVTGTGLRERKKAKTRVMLERAALELFAEQGFDETTIEQISAACEVSPRTFFRYFASKEDVLHAESDRRLSSLVADVEARRGAGQPPFEAVRGAVIHMVEDFQGDRASLELHARVVARNTAALTRGAERQHLWEDGIFSALGVVDPSSDRRDVLELRLLAAMATAALRAATQEWEAQHAARATGQQSTPEPLGALVRYAFNRISTGLDPKQEVTLT